MVPFGQGSVHLADLVGFLRRTEFSGPVMGEGGGNQAMYNYMSQTLKLSF